MSSKNSGSNTKSAKTPTHIVAIMHSHGDELSTTIGSISIGPSKREDKIAAERIKFWLAAKTRKHNCKRYGNHCGVDIRETVPSLKTVMLLASAEPIVPGPTSGTT